MKRFAMGAICAVAAALLCTTLPVVHATDEAANFSGGNGLSFDPASVRFGYADGYWDNDHRWHGWPSAGEAREFHRRFHDRIYGYRHTRYPNEGWRDGDERRISDSAKPAARREPKS